VWVGCLRAHESSARTVAAVTDVLRALGAVEDLHSNEYVVPPRAADGRTVLLWAGHDRRWVGTWPRLSGESFDGVSNVTSATPQGPADATGALRQGDPAAADRGFLRTVCGQLADTSREDLARPGQRHR